jgi:hypothetical protein
MSSPFGVDEGGGFIDAGVLGEGVHERALVVLSGSMNLSKTHVSCLITFPPLLFHFLIHESYPFVSLSLRSFSPLTKCTLFKSRPTCIHSRNCLFLLIFVYIWAGEVKLP